jgi:ComEC/Rec2-related protein
MTIFSGAWVMLSWHNLCAYDLLLVPFSFLLFPSRRLLWAFLLFIVAAASTMYRVVLPSEAGRYDGDAFVEVVDRHLVSHHGVPSWKVQLYVHQFSSHNEGDVLRGVTVPSYNNVLRGGAIYKVPLHLLWDENFGCKVRLSDTNTAPIVKKTISLVESRVHVKRYLEGLFARLFPDSEIRNVAGALSFGLFKDPVFQLMMHRAGVEHVLAISGFHFGIVAALTVFIARGMSYQLRSIFAMAVLTAYLAIIGPLPSVVRAWSAAMVVLLGVFLGKKTSGLNCLGVGLLTAVIYDPASIVGVGFQLSFLATFAILLFSRETLEVIQRVVPAKDVTLLTQFSVSDQILTCVLSWLLPVFSLAIPVLLIITPYQLAFLQDFSLLSVLYNLFIPMLFSFAMPAILLAVVLSPVGPLSSFFAWIAQVFLQLGISCINNVPEVSWGLLDGGVICGPLGRLLIVTMLVVGLVREGAILAGRNDEWKACL